MKKFWATIGVAGYFLTVLAIGGDHQLTARQIFDNVKVGLQRFRDRHADGVAGVKQVHCF